MSFIGKIFGTAGAETARGLAKGIGGLALDIRSAITGDMRPETRAKLEELAQKGDQMAQQGQADVNMVEAQHRSLFVAGWRPFIGWICGISVGYHYLVYPNLIWAMTIWFTELKPPPPMGLEDLWPVIVGMLGLGVYRSYEKARGAQNRH